MPRFSTHTTRHLCLTDLARMGWELHAIATFAGHRSTDSTLQLHPPVRAGPGGQAELAAWRTSTRGASACSPDPESRRTAPVTAVAPAWPADQRTRVRRLGAFDRTAAAIAGVALLDSEAAALLALGPAGPAPQPGRGIPRRDAPHWRALARLVEPLDAALAALHHGDDVRYRRAGSATRRRSCCGTAPTPAAAWWGWTAVGVGAAVSAPARSEFRAAQPLPTDDDGAAVRGRAGLPARRVQRLPPPGQLQPAAPGRLIFGATAVDETLRRGRRGARPVGLPRQRRRRDQPAAGRGQPGPAAQPQPPAGRT